MYRLTAVMLACALSFAARGEQSAANTTPAWVERSNSYTNTLLEVEFTHSPERGSRQGLARFDGQANSYFYGYTRLLWLRQEVEAALGTEFQPRKFHDFILSQGLLPPELMRQAVLEEFVPSQK
jgi:hypothetical protein